MNETAKKASHAPLDWGASREMNAIEALMWRGEADPRLRSTICSFGVLDCAPDWQRFLAACEWGTRMVPRFRQKVVEPAFGLGNPVWVNDPDFDLHYHVRRQRITEGGGWREALECAEQIAMTPFDRARSPLEVVLFEGLPEARAGTARVEDAARCAARAARARRAADARQRARRRGRAALAAAPPDLGCNRCGGLRLLAAAHARRTHRRGVPALAPPQPLVALPGLRRVVPAPARGGEERGRFAQRRLPLRAARRVPPLPREVRRGDRDDADRDSDLRAARRRSRGRQPLHGRALRCARRRDRPRAAHEEDGRPRARR